MASLLKSQTARQNGAKSRGPITPEGKANSAAHRGPTRGLLSKIIVIEGEAASRFAALLAEIRADLEPQDSIEEGLVEDLATYRWRQRRLMVMETAMFSDEIRRTTLGTSDSPLPPGNTASNAVTAIANLIPGSNALEVMHRMELSFNRQYNRTLHRLFAIRAHRKMNSPAENPPND